MSAPQHRSANQHATEAHQVRKPKRERWRYAQLSTNTPPTHIKSARGSNVAGFRTLFQFIERWLELSHCVAHIAIAHALAFAPCADLLCSGWLSQTPNKKGRPLFGTA